MVYKPKTAEQIFLANVLVRLVETHLLRRKIRAVLRTRTDPLYKIVCGNKTLDKLDDRINLLSRTYNKHGRQYV